MYIDTHSHVIYLYMQIYIHILVFICIYIYVYIYIYIYIHVLGCLNCISHELYVWFWCHCFTSMYDETIWDQSSLLNECSSCFGRYSPKHVLNMWKHLLILCVSGGRSGGLVGSPSNMGIATGVPMLWSKLKDGPRKLARTFLHFFAWFMSVVYLYVFVLFCFAALLAR